MRAGEKGMDFFGMLVIAAITATGGGTLRDVLLGIQPVFWKASGTILTEIFGIGPILAARIIGTVGDVARFPTKAHFAPTPARRR